MIGSAFMLLVKTWMADAIMMVTPLYFSLPGTHYINSSLPGQNGRNFADDISSSIFVNEKFCVLIKISLKFVAKGTIDNNWALV